MNYLGTIIRLIGRDVGGFFVFPLWWYTRGLIECTLFLREFFSRGIKRLGVGVWIQNIFIPMFGQYDWEGRLISILVRVMQIIVRSIFIVFWLVICVFLFLLWILVPIIAILGIVNQLRWFIT